jgi:isoleucyl-tRNA synthetase
VTDRIEIAYHGTEQIVEAVGAHADWIRNETLALELQRSDPDQLSGGTVETFEIGDEQLTIGVRRVDPDEAMSV